MQLAENPECSLFSQEIVGDAVHVRYQMPKTPLVPSRPEQQTTLQVPLDPDTSQLGKAVVNLHQSAVSAYRMGSPYDEWFSACFGFDTVLIYIGDERRPVLGSFSPRTKPAGPAAASRGGWLSSLSTLVMGSGQPASDVEPDWLAFTDVAPYLVATEQSLRNVKARLSDSSDADIMYKFRPNIVVDGEGEEAFAEDFWSELSVNGEPAFALTMMCNRCSSLNVDYDTGRPAEGERGTVLKKLMSDRRVDTGFKWSPCFGKYGFLVDGRHELDLAVNDSIEVTKRSSERPVFDWPTKKDQTWFYTPVSA